MLRAWLYGWRLAIMPNVSEPPATARALPTAFFSYARPDILVVRRFAELIRPTGIEVLLDVEFLMPGERFETAILDRVRSADAFVFFVSPRSLESRWVEAEVFAYSEASGKAIFPVLINGAGYDRLPAGLSAYQALLVEDDSEIPRAAIQLSEALISHVSRARQPSPEAEREAARLAAGIAANIRAPARDPAKVGNSVFLVHGHDNAFRDEVDQYLQTLGLRSVILSKMPGRSRSLLDKFETYASQAAFAVVLVSPDDLGASRRQYGHNKEHPDQTLKYRARENVILELGFFYGRLGWDHVFVVQKAAEDPWPDFERPSDLAGVLFFDTEAEIDWRQELAERLREAELLVSPKG